MEAHIDRRCVNASDPTMCLQPPIQSSLPGRWLAWLRVMAASVLTSMQNSSSWVPMSAASVRKSAYADHRLQNRLQMRKGGRSQGNHNLRQDEDSLRVRREHPSYTEALQPEHR